MVSSTASKSASLMLRARLSRVMPALFTRMWRLPKEEMTSFTMASQAAASATSARMVTAWTCLLYTSALVDVSAGGELYSGGALVRNHLYLATMSDHYLVAGNSTVKVLARGGYRVS